MNKRIHKPCLTINKQTANKKLFQLKLTCLCKVIILLKWPVASCLNVAVNLCLCLHNYFVWTNNHLSTGVTAFNCFVLLRLNLVIFLHEFEGLCIGESVRVNRNLELSDLELSKVNLVTLWRKKIGTGGKTWVIRKFELSEFELTSFNCTWY